MANNAQSSDGLRLSEALRRAGITRDDLAEAIGVSPGTVDRWAVGRHRPRNFHRHAIAELLGTTPDFIWPAIEPEPLDEIVAAWSTRADVPAETWSSLIQSNARRIDILAYAGAFLADVDPRWWQRVSAAATFGAEVRIALGDPESDAVRQRGADEGIGGPAVAARITGALGVVQASLAGLERVTIAIHQTPLHLSWFRSDDDAIACTHLWGASGALAPTWLLRRHIEGGLFDNFSTAFERVWKIAAPLDQHLVTGGTPA